MGEWRYSSTILDLGTRWRWVVSFTPWSLYPRGKRPRYPLDRRVGERQSTSGLCGVEKNILRLSGFKPRPSRPRYTDWTIADLSDVRYEMYIVSRGRGKRVMKYGRSKFELVSDCRMLNHRDRGVVCIRPFFPLQCRMKFNLRTTGMV
jgi:hypothetical protein